MSNADVATHLEVMDGVKNAAGGEGGMTGHMPAADRNVTALQHEGS